MLRAVSLSALIRRAQRAFSIPFANHPRWPASGGAGLARAGLCAAARFWPDIGGGPELCPAGPEHPELATAPRRSHRQHTGAAEPLSRRRQPLVLAAQWLGLPRARRLSHLFALGCGRRPLVPARSATPLLWCCALQRWPLGLAQRSTGAGCPAGGRPWSSSVALWLEPANRLEPGTGGAWPTPRRAAVRWRERDAGSALGSKKHHLPAARYQCRWPAPLWPLWRGGGQRWHCRALCHSPAGAAVDLARLCSRRSTATGRGSNCTAASGAGWPGCAPAVFCSDRQRPWLLRPTATLPEPLFPLWRGTLCQSSRALC